MPVEPLLAADPALVEQALREGAVATQRPAPGIADYGADLGAAVARFFIELLGSILGAVGGAVSADFLVDVLFGVLALAVAALLFLVLRWLLEKRRPRPVVELAPQGGPPALPPGADWEAEVETRLARGEARPALEALWWWLAGRIEARSAERSWTTRELVRRAGRKDLLRAVVPLDRFLYGAGEPRPSEVRDLFDTLRRRLGAGPAEEPA